ncbi:MAG: TetR/AcrR family transcriptional regulator [Pseudomonadota bacterium]
MAKLKSTDELDETALQILEAASSRFLHYGYGKTTMSEIARDCNMSTGNLYRYFPAKMDIAEAFVRVLRREHIAKLTAAALEPKGLTPEERLRRFLRTKFKLAYDRFHDRPKAFELSTEIIRERHHVAERWQAAEANLIADILSVGEAEGVFRIDDKPRMAHIIQDMVYRFTTPVVFHEGDCEELSGELDDIIDMILDAFAWRRGDKASKPGDQPKRMRVSDLESAP